MHVSRSWLSIWEAASWIKRYLKATKKIERSFSTWSRFPTGFFAIGMQVCASRQKTLLAFASMRGGKILIVYNAGKLYPQPHKTNTAKKRSICTMLDWQPVQVKSRDNMAKPFSKRKRNILLQVTQSTKKKSHEPLWCKFVDFSSKFHFLKPKLERQKKWRNKKLIISTPHSTRLAILRKEKGLKIRRLSSLKRIQNEPC